MCFRLFATYTYLILSTWKFHTNSSIWWYHHHISMNWIRQFCNVFQIFTISVFLLSSNGTSTLYQYMIPMWPCNKVPYIIIPYSNAMQLKQSKVTNFFFVRFEIACVDGFFYNKTMFRLCYFWMREQFKRILIWIN